MKTQLNFERQRTKRHEDRIKKTLQYLERGRHQCMDGEKQNDAQSYVPYKVYGVRSHQRDENFRMSCGYQLHRMASSYLRSLRVIRQ